MMIIMMLVLSLWSVPVITTAADRDAAHNLDVYLERLVPFGFSGTVLLARNGEVLLNKGYGWANVEARVPNTDETVFPIESVTKQFTAAAIVTLEMQGELQTSDPISRFFANVPDDKTKVTLHHLLTHTSGIITGTDEYYDDASREAIIDLALSTPLRFSPGERDAYSNIGYALLAAVVEQVSGMDFEAYLYTTLFAPAGLESTGYRRPDWSARTLAHRYALGEDNGTVLDSPFPDWNRIGASDVMSTTQDLFRWHTALLGSDILSEESKRRMYTPVANDYGYGWYISDGDHGRLVEHDGGSSKGTAADFRRYLEEDLVIIVLTNHDGEYMLFSARLRDNIRDLVFGASLPLVPAIISKANAPIDGFTGGFRFDDESNIDIKTAGGLIEIAGVGQTTVTALLSMTEVEATRYAAMSNRTGTLLQGMQANDFEPLIDASAGKMGAQLEAMFAGMIKASGEITGYTVLGTIPPTGVDDANYMTLFRIEFAGKSQIFRFYWSKDGIIALGGGGMSEPVRLRAVPLGDDTFIGYHIPTSRPVELHFQRGVQGQVTGVTVGQLQLRAIPHNK